MRRPLMLISVLLSGLGCQTTTNQTRLLIGPDQAKKIDLTLSGPIAGDTAGFVYFVTPGNLMRYDPKSHQIEPMLVNPSQEIRDVAVTPDGGVLALLPQELDAYVAGHLVKVHGVPGRAAAVSCDREFAYLLTTTPKGAALLRYHLTGGKKGTRDTLLTLEDRPGALCAVPGGCLVASGGNIVKVTDPIPTAGQAEPLVATVLLVALRENVTSVAVDPRHGYVYFATTDSTFVWAQGRILPVFPAGSRLAWVNDTLTVCQPSVGQVVQIGAVSGHVQRLLAGG
ncbi:MAG: hypothetical protein FJ280_08750 [Planctomycetes bacterium]|nr:hypothetical protein [Planctomycetota bacterium]